MTAIVLSFLIRTASRRCTAKRRWVSCRNLPRPYAAGGQLLPDAAVRMRFSFSIFSSMRSAAGV